jgi:hypothetical protein
MDDKDYGNSIWRGFYGPAKNFLLLGKEDLFFIIKVAGGMLAIGLLFVFTAPFAADAGKQNLQKYMGYFCMAMAIVLLVGGLVGRTIKVFMIHDGEFYKLTRSGKRDWDLYENGMHSSFLSETTPGHIESRFIPFSVITKAYFNLNPDQIDFVIEKMKERDKKGLDFDPEDYLYTEKEKKIFKDSVWLTTNDQFVLYELDKHEIRDLKRFENIIRQKVKDVE